MINSKKILPLIACILMLASSCAIFNGGHDRGSRHCDCPKFGEQVTPGNDTVDPDTDAALPG